MSENMSVMSCAMIQTAFDFQALSLADLRVMLAAGMVEPCGATEGGVVSYRLTSVGRIVLENQLRKEARGDNP